MKILIHLIPDKPQNLKNSRSAVTCNPLITLPIKLSSLITAQATFLSLYQTGHTGLTTAIDKINVQANSSLKKNR